MSLAVCTHSSSPLSGAAPRAFPSLSSGATSMAVMMATSWRSFMLPSSFLKFTDKGAARLSKGNRLRGSLTG